MPLRHGPQMMNSINFGDPQTIPVTFEVYSEMSQKINTALNIGLWNILGCCAVIFIPKHVLGPFMKGGTARPGFTSKIVNYFSSLPHHSYYFNKNLPVF